MRISQGIRDIFGRFQNLNLLALLHDLRNRQTAQADWSAGGFLCPLAHGLATGVQIREVNVLGQISNLKKACEFAAQCLGADCGEVVHFVRTWDDQTLGTEVLLGYLEDIWEERLEDAKAVQQILQPEPIPHGQGDRSAICFHLQERTEETSKLLHGFSGEDQPQGTIHEHAVTTG